MKLKFFKAVIDLSLLAVIALCFIAATKTDDELMELLGIQQSGAQDLVEQGLINETFDTRILKKAREILPGKRPEVIRLIYLFARNYITSDHFRQHYETLRMSEKPALSPLQSPEEMQASTIQALEKSFEESKNQYANATEALKPVFKSLIEETEKLLADARDPASEQNSIYRENYAAMKEMQEIAWKNQLTRWEEKYPEKTDDYIRIKLTSFLLKTENIDFNADLKDENGKMKFVNPAYESKDKQWKLAFRLGPEVISTARKYAEQWLAELNT